MAWGRRRPGGQREVNRERSHVRGSWEATKANRRGGGAWPTATSPRALCTMAGRVSSAGRATLDICRPGQMPLGTFGHIWPGPGQDASHPPCLEDNRAGKLQSAETGSISHCCLQMQGTLWAKAQRKSFHVEPNVLMLVLCPVPAGPRWHKSPCLDGLGDLSVKQLTSFRGVSESN